MRSLITAWTACQECAFAAYLIALSQHNVSSECSLILSAELFINQLNNSFKLLCVAGRIQSPRMLIHSNLHGVGETQTLAFMHKYHYGATPSTRAAGAIKLAVSKQLHEMLCLLPPPLITARFAMLVRVEGWSSPSSCFLFCITTTLSSSASFHRPWLLYVGWSSPNSCFLFCITITSSSSASFHRPCFCTCTQGFPCLWGWKDDHLQAIVASSASPLCRAPQPCSTIPGCFTCTQDLPCLWACQDDHLRAAVSSSASPLCRAPLPLSIALGFYTCPQDLPCLWACEGDHLRADVSSSSSPLHRAPLPPSTTLGG